MNEYISKQLGGLYNGELNALFEEWKKSYPPEAHAEDYFCKDGLVVKYKDADSGYDINKEWDKSSRKIMFLFKDCPDGWAYDTRTILTGYQDDEQSLVNAANTRKLKGSFFKNIATILYGLYNMTDENKGSELSEDIKNNSKLVSAFNEIPFAYVECKKMAGGRTCSDSSLNNALNSDNEFLSREINILKPNIIVCCDSMGYIFNNVVNNYFGGKIPDEDSRWEYDYEYNGSKCGFRCKLYYYESEGVLLFNSYHPSAPQGWKIPERVLSPFRQFLQKYGTFDVVLERKTESE